MLSVRKVYWPSINILGPGALNEALDEIKKMNLGKALIVSDKVLEEVGVVKKITDKLDILELKYSIYSNVNPNPTMKNVNDGLKIFETENCEYIISIGGGSPQDAAKAIGILSTNGGNIRDYNGIFKSTKKSAPIVAINTTAGTASEVTINYVITDEENKIKMVMVDPNSLATIAVSDPELMIKKPSLLTAATGMDALTHAIEAYTTLGAYRMSDTLALESIKLIGESLLDAVNDGKNIEARSKMAWGSYIAGLSFSNCGLGIVHSLAHQLGAEYDLPHGIANAILLPEVMEYNLISNYKKFGEIAKALGQNIDSKNEKEAAIMSVIAVRKLLKTIGIPTLSETKFRLSDVKKLSNQAFNDVCTGGNSRVPTIQDLENIYINAYNREK